MTYAAVVARAAATLVAGGFAREDAEADAAVLARHILGWDLAQWLSHHRDRAPASFGTALEAAIARRATREPIAYIIGEREFYGRAFTVGPAVLIPRPETEIVVDESLRILKDAPGRALNLADIGTGSGCLAITLALELPGAHVVATDLSAAALDVARHNARRLGVADRVEFRHGAFFAGAAGPFDLVVSNPPYVAEADRASIMADVVDFEPSMALFSGPQGLSCIRDLVHLAPARLRPEGALIFEFGFGQKAAVEALLSGPAWRLVDVRDDLQGIPRVAIAQPSSRSRSSARE